MTKGLKVFNIILIVVLVFVALSALVSVAYWAVDAFKITALNSVKTFIADNFRFMVMGTGAYAVNDFLASQIAALDTVKTYIILSFDLLLCIWSIALLVTITKPEDHYCKFRPWTFVINLFFAIFFILNAHFAFNKLLDSASVTNVLAFVVSLLGIAILVIHLNMNLCGRYSMKEENHDPNDIFPTKLPQNQQNVVHPQPKILQQNQFGQHINTQPPRRMPPPPPPAQ